MNGSLIGKEEIPALKIIPASEDHTKELNNKLRGAMRLGNEFKSKASIIFQTDQGVKRVETTVWAVTEHFIQLKNGVVIPVKSLIDIEY